VIVTSLALDKDSFEAATGWALKPIGACKGEMCVPLRGADDLPGVAERLGMALVHDEGAQLWALGPETVSGKALSSAEAPELTLPDRNGEPFVLRSLRGQKIFLLAWASW